MDERLNLVGEMLILVGQGQGHLEFESQCEGRPLAVDGSEGDGSLKAVGVAHGESPYWSYGGSSCVLSVIGPADARSGAEMAREQLLLSSAIPLSSRTT